MLILLSGVLSFIDKESQTLQRTAERRGKTESEKGRVFVLFKEGGSLKTKFHFQILPISLSLSLVFPSLVCVFLWLQLESSLPRGERKLAMQKAKSEALMKRQENVRDTIAIFPPKTHTSTRFTVGNML